MRTALDTGDYRVEFRVTLPEGGTRWLAARGRTVENGTGTHIVGVAYDVTDVRSARDHAAHVLATMSSGYLALDRDWRVTYMNAEAERVLGRSYEQLAGENLWEQLPGSDERAFGHYYRAAMSTGRVVAFEDYYPELATWLEVRAVPGTDGSWCRRWARGAS